MIKQRVCVISGGFDPLHRGHIFNIREAKNRFDIVCAILNSDEFLIRKKGYISIPYEDRFAVLYETLGTKGCVFKSVDNDQTVIKSLIEIREIYPSVQFDLFFMKGGDRTEDNIPEKEICRDLGIRLCFDGGSKVQSSSIIAEESITSLVKSCHKIAVDKGWYVDKRNLGELLMLIVTEISEACEALREDYLQKEFDKTDWRKDTFEDELADAVIRIFDLAAYQNIDLYWQIRKKMEYNKTRDNKHGKKF